MELIVVKRIPKWRVALESAGRTFAQAFVPAALLSWQASNHEMSKAAGMTAAGAGLAAGLAALQRVLMPTKTDRPTAAVK